MTDSLMDVLVARGVYWVPTITVGLYVAGPRGGAWPAIAEHQRRAFARALKKGVKIALGTDAGGFPWTELNQAREFAYYVQYGMTPMQAIKSGTSLAAELLAGRIWARSRRGCPPTSWRWPVIRSRTSRNSSGSDSL
ncbi:MAG: amidohydrolase family protein [Gemmatimonadaceae bacterium]